MERSDGVHLWLVLWKAHDAVRAHAGRSIQCLGLGQSDFRVLEVLLHKGPLPVNTIGPIVRLTPGSISVAIDRLEAKGCVERRTDPQDGRARIVHLTPEGEKMICDAFERHAAALDQATSGLTSSERTQAIKLLRKLGLHAEELL